MNQETILGIVRHVLTFLGGFLITKGLATSDEITTGIAALITLAGLIWSIIAKRNTVKIEND